MNSGRKRWEALANVDTWDLHPRPRTFDMLGLCRVGLPGPLAGKLQLNLLLWQQVDGPWKPADYRRGLEELFLQVPDSWRQRGRHRSRARFCGSAGF